MAQDDGDFSVSFSIDGEADEEDDVEYADTLEEVRARAIEVLAEGRFRFATLWARDDDGEWEEVETLTDEDVDEEE